MDVLDRMEDVPVDKKDRPRTEIKIQRALIIGDDPFVVAKEKLEREKERETAATVGEKRKDVPVTNIVPPPTPATRADFERMGLQQMADDPTNDEQRKKRKVKAADDFSGW